MLFHPFIVDPLSRKPRVWLAKSRRDRFRRQFNLPRGRQWTDGQAQQFGQFDAIGVGHPAVVLTARRRDTVGDPAPILWLLKFDVQFSSQMSTRPSMSNWT